MPGGTGSAHPFGQLGAAHGDGGVLYPLGGAAQRVPPVPFVSAERVRRDAAAHEPEI